MTVDPPSPVSTTPCRILRVSSEVSFLNRSGPVVNTTSPPRDEILFVIGHKHLLVGEGKRDSMLRWGSCDYRPYLFGPPSTSGFCQRMSVRYNEVDSTSDSPVSALLRRLMVTNP